MRAGYSDDCDLDNWQMICWQGAVKSAIKGQRGQAFLRELVTALDSLPAKRLIADDLQAESGDVCAIGSVGRLRNMDMAKLDPDDYDEIAAAFGVAQALVREIEYVNDEYGFHVTPEKRFGIVREWALSNLVTSNG